MIDLNQVIKVINYTDNHILSLYILNHLFLVGKICSISSASSILWSFCAPAAVAAEAFLPWNLTGLLKSFFNRG